MKKGAHSKFAMGAILHWNANDCELPCRSVECVLLGFFDAQPYIFAVVNCVDVALSVFYSAVLTSCRIVLQLRTALTALSATVFCSGLLTWLERWFYVLIVVTHCSTSKESACRMIGMLCEQTSPKLCFAKASMTSYCDVTNSAYPVTLCNIRDCSILEFDRRASNQAVTPGINHHTSARHCSTAVPIYNVSSKLLTQTHQLHYRASRTSSSDTIMSYRKISVPLKRSNVTFTEFFTSTPNFTADKPNYWLATRLQLMALLKISYRTLKIAWDLPSNVSRQCLGVKWCNDHGFHAVLKVLNCEISFQDLKNVCYLAKMCTKYWKIMEILIQVFF